MDESPADGTPHDGGPESGLEPSLVDVDAPLRGEALSWYERGVSLLDRGEPALAAPVLARAVALAPRSRAAHEALARAQFDAGLYPEAVESFTWIVARDPEDDYAQFGLGLAAAQVDDYRTAVDHLAIAAALRPDVNHYALALRGARARLLETS